MKRMETDFHVATFFSEGPPHDRGLALTAQRDHLANAFRGHCTQFHSYSARRVRRLQLRDGTRGKDYVKEYSAVAGYLNYPNTGYNTIGFGAFKPFIILHLLELLERRQLDHRKASLASQHRREATLLFMDCNVLKHWNLAAFAPLAAQTTRWLLDWYGKDGVAMPRENPSTRHVHICSHSALLGIESRWSEICRDGTAAGVRAEDVAQTPSPHSNRLAVRISDPAASAFLRGWLAASHNETEYLPSPVRPSGRWHTPEQCSFGLMDACRHGRSELWFEYFFTPRHARLFAASTRLPGVEAKNPIPVARTRTPPRHIDITHRWGMSLTAVADSLKLSTQRERSNQPSPLHDDHKTQASSILPPGWRTSGRIVDACLAFPRLAMRCPGVLYRNNGTHWNFDKLSRPFVARAL